MFDGIDLKNLNLGDMINKFQGMAKEQQEKSAQNLFTAKAGGGMVEISINGNSEVVDLTRLKKPRPSLFRSIEKSTSKTYRDLSATDSFISFSKNKTFKPIIKEIKKLMKSKKSRLPIPVFVYTDDDGAFESIYIHHNLTDAESLNLSKYTDLVINKTVKQKSAAKYVFLLKN